MKRIFLSLLIIILAGIVSIGATNAYFFDNESSQNNHFTSGTFEIRDNSSTLVPFTFSDLKPGDSKRKWIVLKNTGSVDIDRLTVIKVNVIDTNDLLTQIKVSVTGRVGFNSPAYFTDDWQTLGPKPTISSWFNNSDLLDNSFYLSPAGVIRPGEVYTLSFDLSLPSAIGSQYQGKTASFDLRFDAQQEI